MKNQIKVALLTVVVVAVFQGCATTKPATTPDEQYKAGEKSFQKGNYEDAIEQWKKVKESYESQELSTQAEIGIANSYFLNKDYIEAAAAYDDFRKLHPKHEKAGFALFRQGLSHYNQIKGIDTDQTPVKNSLVILDSYLKLYPGGEHTAEVNEKIAQCRDKQLQYEIYVGRFYLRSDNFPAAIARFDTALKTFPEASRRDEVLYYLGKSYMADGQKPKSLESYQRLIKEFPGSPFVKDAQKAIN
jgi:outer membrane protein assembly factor BamD